MTIIIDYLLLVIRRYFTKWLTTKNVFNLFLTQFYSWKIYVKYFRLCWLAIIDFYFVFSVRFLKYFFCFHQNFLKEW